jgi:uncharacterized protein YndB with AHSA1/START domain
MMDRKPVGLTADTGFQIGVRRTLKASQEDIWNELLSPEGLKLWLGETAALEPVKGSRYRTEDGTAGEVRAVKLREQFRLTWQPAGWSQPSTLQIRLLPAARGTTVSFHQEKLADSSARERMKQRWEAVLAELCRRWGE